MIGKLTGKIDSSVEDHAIIDVGGVGYMVFCSSKTLASFKPGSFISLMVETHVREDHIHLFGFRTQEEKSVFNILQSVSGIGTRVALMNLSCRTPAELQGARDTDDKEGFRRVSGVGPKLAERIKVELKGKVLSHDSIVHSTGKGSANSELASDAISALTNLGMNKHEVAGIVGNIIKQNPEISINDLIKIVLQRKSKL